MKLTIPAPLLEQLRDELIQDDDLERFAYLYCGQHTDNDLLVGGFEPVPQDKLEVMERGACRPESSVERDHITSCIDYDAVPVMAHSHPFADYPGFSGTDVATIDEYRDWLTGLYPGEPFGFLVVGNYGVDATAFDPTTDELVSMPVDILGTWTLDDDWQVPTESDEQDDTSVDGDRYDRTIRALTTQGQQELAATSVAVIGCGGIGSLLCEQLARLGVTDLTLIDPDVVEASNLPRLYGAADHHIGRAKVDMLEQHLWQIQPDASVTTLQHPVEEVADHLHDVDVVLAGVDQVSTRSFLNEYAVRYLTPYIDAGSIIRTADSDDELTAVTAMHGFVQTIVPGVTACFDCLDRGDHEQERLERMTDAELEEQVDRGYVDDEVLTPEPAVIHLNSAVASKAVSEFTKLVTGFAEPAGFLRIEDLANDLVEVTTTPSPECITCGGDLLGRGTPPVLDDEPIEDAEDLPVDDTPV